MIGRASIEKATTRIFPSSKWRPRLGFSLVALRRRSAPLDISSDNLDHPSRKRPWQLDTIARVDRLDQLQKFRPHTHQLDSDRQGRPICRSKEIHNHRVGVTRQGDEILSARAMRPSEPMLHGPLTCASPSHHRFYGLRAEPSSPFSAAAIACSNSPSAPDRRGLRCNSLPFLATSCPSSVAKLMVMRGRQALPGRQFIVRGIAMHFLGDSRPGAMCHVKIDPRSQ